MSPYLALLSVHVFSKPCSKPQVNDQVKEEPLHKTLEPEGALDP